MGFIVRFYNNWVKFRERLLMRHASCAIILMNEYRNFISSFYFEERSNSVNNSNVG